MPLAKIARLWGVPYHSLDNHKKNHLTRQLLKAHDIKETLDTNALCEEIQSLAERTKEILNTAESKEEYCLSLQAIKELRETYGFMVKLAVTLDGHRQQEIEGQADSRTEQFQENLRRLTPDELLLFAHLIRKMNGEDSPAEDLPSIGTRAALPQPSQVIDIEPTVPKPAVRVPEAMVAPRVRTAPTAAPTTSPPRRRNPYAHGSNEPFDPANPEHQKQAAKERLEAKELHAHVTGDYGLTRLPS